MKPLIAFLCFLVTQVARGEPLVVHEWGTFTSLQDENGRAVSGINSDEEKLPEFVHDIGGGLIAKPSAGRDYYGKGIVRCHPDVTMRLETPVVYFYPHVAAPVTLDLQVEFQGGWLTQFYPQAEAKAPGLITQTGSGRLNAKTVGTLLWRQLEVGSQTGGPASTDRVWTSPRQVAAANVKSRGGEAEKFLFYRGVGHLEAPLRVVRNAVTDGLQVFANESGGWNIPAAWLVHLRENGDCAFQALPPIATVSGTEQVSVLPARFAGSQFSPRNLQTLRLQMHDALMRQGLFSDEATALLNTWEQSYFKSPGLRLFFLLPQSWTDQHLPLTISVPAIVTRAMVGRIELITPEQRAGMQSLAQARTGFSLAQSGDKEPAATSQDEMLRSTYKNLGRFRDALLLDEQHLRPTPGLAKLLEDNSIQYAQ